MKKIITAICDPIVKFMYKKVEQPQASSSAFLPFPQLSISRQDIDAVVTDLESDWITTNPKVAEHLQVMQMPEGFIH